MFTNATIPLGERMGNRFKPEFTIRVNPDGTLYLRPTDSEPMDIWHRGADGALRVERNVHLCDWLNGQRRAP